MRSYVSFNEINLIRSKTVTPSVQQCTDQLSKSTLARSTREHVSRLRRIFTGFTIRNNDNVIAGALRMMNRWLRVFILIAIGGGVALPGACAGTTESLFWKGAGNGENGEIMFGRRDPLGYADKPLEVLVYRREVRRKLLPDLNLHGGGNNTEERIAGMTIRDAHCEPETLCKVAIENQPGAGSGQFGQFGQLRVNFLKAGEGKLVVRGRSGISFFTDSWPIAAEPLPDGIAHEPLQEIIMPRGSLGAGKFVLEVAGTAKGARLRGSVTARIEDSTPNRWGFEVVPQKRVSRENCPVGIINCSATPLAELAEPQRIEIRSRGRGRAVLVLSAGPFSERIPIRAVEHLESARVEIFACDDEKTNRDCHQIDDEPVRCKAGQALYARSYVTFLPDGDRGDPLRSAELVPGTALATDRINATATVGTMVTILLRGEKKGFNARRYRCVEAGSAELRMPDELTNLRTSRHVEVYGTAPAGVNRPAKEPEAAVAPTIDVHSAKLPEADAAYKRGDYVTAAAIFDALVADGNAEAMLKRGYMHEKYHKGVTSQYAEGTKLIRRAAELGNADAQLEMGARYRRGKGVSIDRAEALRWITKAAEQGYPPGQCALGETYINGDGVLQNYTEALKWFRLAAVKNYGPAQNNLGLMYENGRGVKQDVVEATKWYQLAADMQDPQAQLNLGLLYDRGKMVPHDDTAAVKWFRKAAVQNVALAQYNLGLKYAEGKGVPMNDTRAYMWLSIAYSASIVESRDAQMKSLSESAISHRDQVAGRMTAQLVKDAKRMAHECQMRRRIGCE
jgi:TPR repeat protein